MGATPKAKRAPKRQKATDKKQSERFIEAARKHEADESGKAFEKVFRKIVGTRPRIK